MVDFKPNGNFAKTFYTPGGEVGRWLRREARRVETVSKTMVGVDTGALKRSIRTDKVNNLTAKHLRVEIGSMLPYALVHHDGSKPHTIVAGPGEVLHWGGARGPTVVAVTHPGTKGTKYLLRALHIVTGSYAKVGIRR